MFQRKTPTLSDHSCSHDACLDRPTDSCHRCDVILGIDGACLIEATRTNQQLTLAVETIPGLMGCPQCGVVAESKGRRIVDLVDAPWAGVPVRLRWHKRRWIGDEPRCEVVAGSTGGRLVDRGDAPWAGGAGRLRWHRRRWMCHGPLCEGNTCTEEHPPLCAPRAKLTTRCITWAIGQLRRENASIRGLARPLGVSWDAVWDQIRPVLEAKAADESRV